MPERECAEDTKSLKWGDERARRLRALQELANQSGAANGIKGSEGANQDAPSRGDHGSLLPSAPILSQGPLSVSGMAVRHRVRQRWYLVMVCIVGVALLGVLVSHFMTPGKGTSQGVKASIVSIVPALDGLQCPQDVVWSPNGSEIAVLGYDRYCATDARINYSYEPGIVAVYAVETGKLVAKFQPDTAITSALELTRPAYVTPAPGGDASQQAIEYEQIAWSPDGTRLALTFTVSIITGVMPNGLLQATTIHGLSISDIQGGHAKVLAHTLKDSRDDYSGEWNTASGTYYTPSASSAETNHTAASGPNADWAIAPALTQAAVTYAWGVNGSLIPQQILTPGRATASVRSGAPAPVGRPDGGSAFAIWQPGEYVALTGARPGTNGSQVDLPGTYTFTTSFLAWSPDGQYVLSAYAQNWRVQTARQPAPAPQALSDLGLGGAPVLPVRDAALEAVLDATPITTPRPTGSGLVAWSPSGRFLAVQPITATDLDTVQPSQRAIRIYDYSTGAVVATLTPTASNQGQQTASYLRWSPSGQQFLLLDDALGTITIWSQDKLPSSER